MGKKRRPCPRGLYDGCPIPRELCSEDYARTGEWHCLKFCASLSGLCLEPLEKMPRQRLSERAKKLCRWRI